MKNFVSTFFLVLYVFLTREECKGQIQLGVSSVYIPSNETGKSLFGCSASGKYFYSKHANAGISIRYIPNFRLFTSTVHTEYIFNTENSLRPYLGIEGGLYRKIGTPNAEGNISTFGGGLKIGLQYAIMPSFGIDLGFTQHISEPAYYKYISESRMINLGIYYNL